MGTHVMRVCAFGVLLSVVVIAALPSSVSLLELMVPAAIVIGWAQHSSL